LDGIAAVRELLERIGPNVATMGENRLNTLTRLSLLPASVAGVLVGALGALTLLLAAIGVTGVLLYLVRQRTAEIGLRMALGASSLAVTRLVVGQCVRWMMIGAAIGVAVSALLSRFIASFLYDVSPADPMSFLGAIALLALVGVGASAIPARLACRTDPMTALRAE